MRRLPLLVLIAALFFAGVWFGRWRERATAPPPPQPRPPSRQEIVDGFHKIYYDASTYTWSATRWLGAPVLKNPLDLWVMQEIVYETRPDVIIEAGTYLAGAAAFFGSLFDLLGRGRVVTIDIKDYPERVKHPRVHFLLGSSTDPGIVKKVRSFIRPRDKVMVTLDSNHSKGHVAAELKIYSELVTKDQYLIVEDTNVNGHPVQPAFGPGPMEAAEEFLHEHPEFVSEHMREKHILTHNPRGWLRKTR